MTTDNRPQDQILFDFFMEVRHPFTLDDVFNTTGFKKNRKLADDILFVIRSLDDFVEENNRFYPKITFLTDIPIRLQPTEPELKKGILIPGHRLLPFYPSGRSMEDITLLDQGKPLKTKVLNLKMPELQVYFSLMDFPKIPIINIEDILEDDADLQIQVWNLEKFYKVHGFTTGDTIIARSVDFSQGVFSIDYDPYENYQAHFFEIEKPDRLFMTTLREVLEKELHFPNIEKQLLYTYYHLKKKYGEKWPWPQAGTALGPLIRKYKEIKFSPLSNGRVVFHLEHQSPRDLAGYPEDMNLQGTNHTQPGPGDTTAITAFLKTLNNFNSITLVRAILFSRITQGKDFNYPEIEEYLFAGCKKPYMPPEYETVFKELLFQEYKKIEQTFDLKYAYLPITTAREKILEQSLVISRFFRILLDEKIDFDELPKPEMMHLMEMTRSFEEILLEMETLQLQGTDDVSPIHRVIKIIEKAASELPYIFDTIWQKMGF